MTHGYRVLETRDCAYCGDKDAVIITARIAKRRRVGMRFCSTRCSRRGTGCSEQRRQKALNRAVALMAEAGPKGPVAWEEAAKAIYHRGYGAGSHVGKKLGIVIERRRVMRLAAQARRQREAA